MEENIGKWCSFPKAEPRFEGKIINIARREPLIYHIEVDEIPMFKAANEVNLLEGRATIPLSI